MEVVMNMNINIRNTVPVGIVILTLIAAPLVWAGGHGRLIPLEPTKAHPAATGSAFIDGQHVSVQARGLKPDAVYTVWFVNTKPKKHETGAGQPPYMFKTDTWGNGSYSAALSETPFDKWAMVMIVQHPNGDPKDMKQMVGALKAML
jgi:hypothetical protein